MLKIGAEPIPGILSIVDGKPKGVIGEVFTKFNSIMPNATWIAIERQENQLNYFAMDIDWPFLVTKLPYLNENVTSGPVLGPDDCYLLSKRNKHIERISSKFSSVFDNINTNALIAMSVVYIILFVMLVIVSAKKNLGNIIYCFMRLFLRQFSAINGKTLLSAKIIIISCAMFCFLSQSISLCYLQTAFITVDNEIKIDTFDDVVFYRRKMYAQNSGSCYEVYKISHLSKNVPLLPYSLPGQLETPSEPGILRSDVVVLTGFTKYFREYGCSFNKRKGSRLVTADEMYYFSKDPVISMVRQVFLRRSTSNHFKAIISWMYNRSESGLVPTSETYALMVFRSIYGKTQDPSCTQSVDLNDHNIKPLKISYFSEFVYIYLVVVSLAGTLFIFEHFFR